MTSLFASIRSKALVAGMLSLVLAFAAVLPMSRLASAQEATPEAEVESVLPDLPVITVTVNEGSYSINVPVPVLPGQYIVTVVNNTDAIAVADLVLLPEEASFGDLTSALFASFQGEGGELPEWWNSAFFAGGSWAGPGASSSTVVNLIAGRWTVFSTNPATGQAPQNISVITEEEAVAAGYIAAPEESATPEASPVAEASPVVDFPTLESNAQFEIADDSLSASTVPSGPALIEVLNTGDQVHDLVFYQVPEGTDAAGAAAIAAEVAAGGSPADATLFASVGTLSPGATAYIESHLAPGTYAVFSTLPDANGGLQADAGVASVLVVE